jgi:hypothetical protein
MRALRRLQREAPLSPFIFVSERGAPFTTAGFARMLERAAMPATLSGAPRSLTCATLMCPTEEQPTPPRQITEVPAQRRIENALKGLEIFNARASAQRQLANRPATA